MRSGCWGLPIDFLICSLSLKFATIIGWLIGFNECQVPAANNGSHSLKTLAENRTTADLTSFACVSESEHGCVLCDRARVYVGSGLSLAGSKIETRRLEKELVPPLLVRLLLQIGLTSSSVPPDQMILGMASLHYPL